MLVGHWYYLLIILVVVILIFGVGKLGDVGGALGKSVRDFKKEVRHDDTDHTTSGSTPL